ncbi:MAG: hypothetical protein JXB00_12290 [Bacteroidales bacterium]|nr:hypothetical protein [Bacteroidales bacterium]
MIKVLKFGILVLLAITVSTLSYSQETEPMKFRDRIYFGGDFSLQFGTMTFIELSPIIGYYITPRLSSGVGVIYQFYREKVVLLDTVFKAHNYGGRFFAKYLLVDNIGKYIPIQINGGLTGYCEYEFLNMDGGFSRYLNPGRFWLNNFYLGGGMEFPIGRRSKMNFLVLWNLNDTGESPYSNPAVRIGVTF